ncbi:MAG: hypothetical protein EPO40_03260 [Myxococcaceae bacterium]|nr:MAG: hypothetical protein EPO40_03260 [Myxococcaceae bacterium]
MGPIDAFIHHLAMSMLAPGESILGVGAFAVGTSTTHGVPAAFELWLAAMTPTRMLCFRTSPQVSRMLGDTDLSGPPRLEAQACTVRGGSPTALVAHAPSMRAAQRNPWD